MDTEANIKTIQQIYEAFGRGDVGAIQDAVTDDVDWVFAVVRFRGQVRATGKTVAQDLHHLFRFHDGKIYLYRGTEDTAQIEAALRG